VGSSLHVFRPASRWLVVRRRSKFSRGIVPSLGIQSWQLWGSRLLKLCVRRGSRCRPSMQRRNRLTSRPSGRAKSSAPLNSSVRARNEATDMKHISLILLLASLSSVSYASDSAYDWVLKQYDLNNTSQISAHTEGRIYAIRYIAIIANRTSPTQDYDPSILIFEKTNDAISLIAKISLQGDNAGGYDVAIKNDSIYLVSSVAHHGVFYARYQFMKVGNRFRMIGAENQSQTSGCYTGVESDNCGKYDFWSGTSYNLLTSSSICWQKKLNSSDEKELVGASRRMEMFLPPKSGVSHRMKFLPVDPQFLNNFDFFTFSLPSACFFDVKNRLQLPPVRP
jgi:hypothetical protein